MLIPARCQDALGGILPGFGSGPLLIFILRERIGKGQPHERGVAVGKPALSNVSVSLNVWTPDPLILIAARFKPNVNVHEAERLLQRWVGIDPALFIKQKRSGMENVRKVSSMSSPSSFSIAALLTDRARNHSKNAPFGGLSLFLEYPQNEAWLHHERRRESPAAAAGDRLRRPYRNLSPQQQVFGESAEIGGPAPEKIRKRSEDRNL